MPATVAECEVLQTEWNYAIALAGGGSVWEDSGLRWSWQPHNGHLMLNFPRSIDVEAATPGGGLRPGGWGLRRRGVVIKGDRRPPA